MNEISATTGVPRVKAELEKALSHARQGHHHEAVASLERSKSSLTGDEEAIRTIQAHLDPLMEKMKRDPFFTLNSRPGDPPSKIRHQYLTLAKSFHPDKSHGTKALFQTIQNAFETLQKENKELLQPPKGLRVSQQENNIQLTWEPIQEQSHIVRYQVEMKTNAITKLFLEPHAVFRYKETIPGQAYFFRVRQGVVDRKTQSTAWSSFSATLAFRSSLPRVVVRTIQFDSDSSCVLRWNMQGCFQVQWRERMPQQDMQQEQLGWNSTKPPTISSSQCRKKRVRQRGQVIEFRVRIINPVTKVKGPWSETASLQCRNLEPLHDSRDGDYRNNDTIRITGDETYERGAAERVGDECAEEGNQKQDRHGENTKLEKNRQEDKDKQENSTHDKGEENNKHAVGEQEDAESRLLSSRTAEDEENEEVTSPKAWFWGAQPNT